MTKLSGPTHVVVDGSNIATEGRSAPSLAQLNEAVLGFIAEHPGVTVTVVVDATFGHRIHKSETTEFDEAVANNELVAPPAGAVGRGDAFVLGIADKAGATVLSNDSFQEFHGTYEWLFDQGRLIGGKPVPHVGWVFVERVPVRGPTSRRAVRESQRRSGAPKDAKAPATSRDSDGPTKKVAARRRGRGAQSAELSAHAPMPVPTAPPPGPALKAGQLVNELLPFLEFVEHHPVGTSVNAVVESYASHGAYVMINDVRAYVPLRLMASPPPKSAREVMKIGEAITLVVAEYAPARRSIDCAVPHMAAGVRHDDSTAVRDAAVAASDFVEPAPSAQGSQRSPARVADEQHHMKEGTTMATAPARKKAAAKKAAPKKAAAKKAAPKKAAPKKAAPKKAAAKKAAAKKAAPKKAAAKKAAAKKAAPKKAAAKKAAPKKAAPKKAAPKKAAPKKAAAKKAAAKKAAPKKAAAKKAAPKKAAAKKAAPKKAAPKKAAPKKAAAKKSSARR